MSQCTKRFERGSDECENCPEVWACEHEQLRAELAAAKIEAADLLTLLVDVTNQGCRQDDDTLCHNFIGAYEDAFTFLEARGLLKNIGRERYVWVKQDDHPGEADASDSA